MQIHVSRRSFGRGFRKTGQIWKIRTPRVHFRLFKVFLVGKCGKKIVIL